MADRRYLLRNIVRMPWYFPVGPDSGLPQTLTPESRMPVGQATALGLRIWFERERGERRPDADPLMEDAILWVEAFAETDDQALTAAAPALELVLDHLSFQLQVRLEPSATDVLDVEPPVAIGEDRPYLMLVEGYKPWKRRLSVDHGAEQTLIVPMIQSDYVAVERHAQRALDWYLLSLSAQSDAERFMLAWIAFEVLDDLLPGVVQGPLIARCGHEIPECPVCSLPTAKPVAGPSRRARLTELGIQDDDARRIWRVRQMMHGSESFGPNNLSDLPRLVQIVRTAVMALLRVALGMPEDTPPFVGYDVPTTSGMALGGHRVLDEDDLPPDYLS